MNDLLYNPVYNALRSVDQGLSFGTDRVKFFDEQVSPFAGFEEGYAAGFSDLYDLLPPGRKILYATPAPIALPKEWQLFVHVPGVQMVFEREDLLPAETLSPTPLGQEHVEEMMALAALTKPGPFGPRTIDFGHYHGFFEKDKLVAMTGQRLHVHRFSEISAVCTHPDHLGKGYASALVQHQVRLILRQGRVPFLHVRDDNRRAIALYERTGFVIQRPMNFYFLRKEKGG